MALPSSVAGCGGVSRQAVPRGSSSGSTYVRTVGVVATVLQLVAKKLGHHVFSRYSSN